ncbi:MAG: aspartate 1-decarboxylase [Spirochaetia bacterium]|nr:aspartate 1-decarboxylase [Spirochaetia bacterium]
MLVSLCRAKVHRATVTQTELDYPGSLTLDRNLIEAGGFYLYEQVSIVNITNGARLETYIIEGERGSGMVCLNGAAARLAQRGDLVIVMAYGLFQPQEIPQDYKATVVHVDKQNQITIVERGETHGKMQVG